MEQGVVVPVMIYTVLNFGFLSSGASEELIVADRVPVAPYTRISASIRIHKRNLATGASFQVIIRGTNPSDRDGADFVDPTDLGSTALITPTAPATVPSLVRLSSIIVDPPHPYVRVVVKAVGPSGSGSVYSILSGDLVMKTG